MNAAVKPVAMAAVASVLTDAVNALTVVVSAVAVMAVVVAVAAAMAAPSAVANVVSSVPLTVPALRIVVRVVVKAVQMAAPKVVPKVVLKAVAVNAANATLKAVARNVRNARPVNSAMMRRERMVNKANRVNRSVSRVNPASNANQEPTVHALSAHAAKEVIARKEMIGPTVRLATRPSRTLRSPTRLQWLQP